MPLVTAISPTVVPPKPGKIAPHIPGGPDAKANHELYLDLSSRDSRPVEVPRAKDDPEFLFAVRDAIVKSRQPGGIPFDVVHISCCSGKRPDIALWDALTDARPSHLEMTCGWDESCNYAGLCRVQPPWDLKSMYLAAYEGDGRWDWDLEDATQQPHSFPACYANLETLVLDYPGGHYLYFYPVGGATNLRSLTILENDSVTVFARTVDCNPKLVETLTSLTLEAKSLATLELAVGNEKGRYSDSSAESEDEDPHQEEGQSETGSSTAAEAGPSNPPVPYHISAGPFDIGEGEEDQGDYSIDHSDGNANEVDRGAEDGDDDDDDDGDPDEPPYTGLPDVLPNTLQYLLLSGPANSIMLKELDEWIVRARDWSWLPNLQTIAFRLVDPAKGKTADVVYLTEKEKRELEQKIEELLNILRQRSPPVEVVEPRPLVQLRYPPTF
ncbi:hypothetical protein EST38_g7318 [Candolleomyces aberdarensis]|uniref:Uncharacterized protein n=1 Tax=Candolleomyces aberdarensis TaxID=2316362 RepID=A0A4Q2DHM2_9AGAR|nr:hypothetical protein EST38_g7318 [Candolleomyces aberdarensis]